MSDLYVRLKDSGNNVYPEIYGIDVNNRLANVPLVNGARTYVATEDCMCYARVNTRNTAGIPYIKVDDTTINACYGTGQYTSGDSEFMFPLKKGQTLYVVGGGVAEWYTGYTIYGLKYHS